MEESSLNRLYYCMVRHLGCVVANAACVIGARYALPELITDALKRKIKEERQAKRTIITY